MRCFKAWAVVSLVAVALCTSPARAVNAAWVPMCLAPPAQDFDAAVSPQPFLDDPGKLMFRDRPKLDRLSLSGRAVPLTAMDPQTEDVTVSLANIIGTVYEETIPAGEFQPNVKLTSWKYTRKNPDRP